MLNVGIVGWRGMVGSVLVERMTAEDDFRLINPTFFSTSQAGQVEVEIGHIRYPVLDANTAKSLMAMDVILSCQGGDYTRQIHPKLRGDGWRGYWIDAASTLRMADHSVIVLDPVNRHVIDKALTSGILDFIGGNCTVSLMLMALGGLFDKNLIQWMTSMTYQAASGAGAKNMRELVAQMKTVGDRASDLLADASSAVSELDKNVTRTLRSSQLPTAQFGVPLAASLIPWIDRAMENGQTKEEWKGYAETNKILGFNDQRIPIDGQCVRISSMRCHSQAFTIKLSEPLPLDDIEALLAAHNQWVKVIPNEKDRTIHALTPAAVTGTLDVPIGRIRKLKPGSDYLTAFTVGDQLLWGAAEPLRRMLTLLIDYCT